MPAPTEYNMIYRTLALAGCCFIAVACSEQQAEAPPAPPPPEVSVFVTEARDVPLTIEFVGETSGIKDIQIRARVEGFLEGLHFQEGSWVNQGDLLYTLESQPFEEKVATRMSAVAEAKTQVAKNRGDLDRIEPLAKINAVSKSDLDAAQAAYDASLSSLEAAEANLRAAQIQLGYTRILSPIDGIIGKTDAKVGEFVGRDPSPVILNTVSQVDTILVTFFVTESQYLRFARHAANAGAAAAKEQEANIHMVLVDGSLYQHPGRFDFLDRDVNTTTGAILAQASFPNPDRLLRPGQFTKLRVDTEIVEGAILIPQRSVSEIQGFFSVFVVDANNIVESRSIEVGAKIGSAWMVTTGLEAGEQVIYEGLQKAREGAEVKPSPAAVKLSDLVPE